MIATYRADIAFLADTIEFGLGVVSLLIVRTYSSEADLMVCVCCWIGDALRMKGCPA